jgi:hypothetical protein
MILWLIRDEHGKLVTKEFSERAAKRFRERHEKNGITGLRIEKVFQSDERPLEVYDKSVLQG